MNVSRCRELAFAGLLLLNHASTPAAGGSDAAGTICNGLVVSGVHSQRMIAPLYDNPLLVSNFRFSYSCATGTAVLVEDLKDVVWAGGKPGNLRVSDSLSSSFEYAFPVQRTWVWNKDRSYIITDSVTASAWYGDHTDMPIERTVDAGAEDKLGSKGLTFLPLFAADYGFEFLANEQLISSPATSGHSVRSAALFNDEEGIVEVVFSGDGKSIESTAFTVDDRVLISVAHDGFAKTTVKYYGHEHEFEISNVAFDADAAHVMMLEATRKTIDSPLKNPSLIKVTVFDHDANGTGILTRTVDGEDASEMVVDPQ